MKKMKPLIQRCVSALKIHFALSFTNFNLQGYRRQMIMHSVSLSLQNDISRNNVPLFLFNVNVQLLSTRASVTEQKGVCAPDWSTSFNKTGQNAAWSTFKMALEWKHDPIRGCTKFAIFFAAVTTS